MPPLLKTFILRLLACAIATYLLWRFMGATGIAVAAPLFAVALARPVIDLMGAARGAAKQMALSGLAGRYFEFRGHALDIAEDEFHRRWISVADVREIIQALPREATLHQQFPQGLQDDPALRGKTRILAEALLAYLEKSSESDSIRFRLWLEREVVFPAANVRQRLGIRDEHPGGGTRQPPRA